MRPSKLLFIHTPKTAGVHIADYITGVLGYRHILSDKSNAEGLWQDYTLDEVRSFIGESDVLLHTHTLSYGWHDLAPFIPRATKEDIVSALRSFRTAGWFLFSFVRHPGDMLCSFYHYVYDYHLKGEHAIVAAHTPVVDRSIDQFVAEHCEKDLVPTYWKEFDFIGEANDRTFSAFFRQHFGHDYQPGKTFAHASSNPGYAWYCAQGAISRETQALVEASISMKTYREIVAMQYRH